MATKRRKYDIGTEVSLDHDARSDSDSELGLHEARRRLRAALKLKRRFDAVSGRYLEGDVYERKEAFGRLKTGVDLYVIDAPDIHTALHSTLSLFDKMTTADDETDRPGYDPTIFDVLRELIKHINAYEDHTTTQLGSVHIYRTLQALRHAQQTLVSAQNQFMHNTSLTCHEFAICMGATALIRASEETVYKDRCTEIANDHLRTLKLDGMQRLAAHTQVNEVHARLEQLIKDIQDDIG